MIFGPSFAGLLFVLLLLLLKSNITMAIMSMFGEQFEGQTDRQTDIQTDEDRINIDIYLMGI